jgi:hypothetical protein
VIGSVGIMVGVEVRVMGIDTVVGVSISGNVVQAQR